MLMETHHVIAINKGRLQIEGWFFYYFHQIVGIHVVINCTPFLADLFFYSYKPDLMQVILKKKEKN